MAFTAGQKVRASQMSVHVCTSSTRPTGHSGQMIYETDTGMTAIYSGSAWYYLTPTGEIASDGQYNSASDQSIPNTTDTLIAFGTNNLTTSLVTKTASGSGHLFRLNRAGRWAISTTIRWTSSAAAGERFHAIRIAGSNIASSGVLKAASSAPVTFNLSVLHRLSSADAGTSAADVDVTAYQSSGASATLESNNGGGWGRLSISWLGP